MKRAVETGDLRQAGKRLDERPCAPHIVDLVRWLDGRQGFEIVQHVAVDQHRCVKSRATEHHTMAGRHHLYLDDIGFQPGNDEVQRRLVVDRLALVPVMGVQRLAGRVLGDEMRVVLHALDLAAAEQRQRCGCAHRIGAKFQAGGTGVDDDDGIGHQWLLRMLGQDTGRIAGQCVGVKDGGRG
jgi:hypothetical protein